MDLSKAYWCEVCGRLRLVDEPCEYCELLAKLKAKTEECARLRLVLGDCMDIFDEPVDCLTVEDMERGYGLCRQALAPKKEEE